MHYRNPDTITGFRYWVTVSTLMLFFIVNNPGIEVQTSLSRTGESVSLHVLLHVISQCPNSFETRFSPTDYMPIPGNKIEFIEPLITRSTVGCHRKKERWSADLQLCSNIKRYMACKTNASTLRDQCYGKRNDQQRGMGTIPFMAL